MNNKTNLAAYDNRSFNPGAGRIKRLLWYFVNAYFLNSRNPWSGLKVCLLRLFGARVGAGVILKPSVNIKYPWNLTAGDNVWIGENVWIDNLAKVTIGNNVCLSQGAMLLTGNHNYKKTTFDLIVGPIVLEDGVWIGAKALVCPNVTCHSHAVLAVNSVAVHNLDAYTIYQGNPTVKIRERQIE